MRIIYTVDPRIELWSLLGLFESQSYVKDKLKNKYQSISNSEIDIRTENIVYCLRQAREFFNSSGQVSLLTSPLLLSYGMLNLTKVLVYYLSPEGTNFKSFFKSHGLSVPFSDKEYSLQNEYIKFERSGTFSKMAEVIGQEIYIHVQTSLKELLSQIPDLSELYRLTYNEYPRVIPLETIKHGYSLKEIGDSFEVVWTQITKMLKKHNVNGYQFLATNQNIAIYKTLAADKSLEQLDILLKSISGVPYLRIIPNDSEKLIIFKELSIAYLIVFAYGMLARYQAARWGKYIDPNLSREAELINKSIIVSKDRFLHLCLNLLFETEIEFKSSIANEKSSSEIVDYIYDDFIRKLNRDNQLY